MVESKSLRERVLWQSTRFLLVVVSASAPASAMFAQPPTGARTPHTDSVSKPAASTDVDAALRPGDVVRLKIWREPDLSGDFTVDEAGVAVFPKVGPLNVGTQSAASLRAMLVEVYSEFLNHKSIDVTLLRRIQVLGAVRQPGVYPVDPTMTISDVLAVAGGATSEGDPNNIELIRDGKQVPGRVARQSLIGESRVRSGDQIFVPERSWARRNSGFLIGTAISATISLVLTLTSRPHR